MSETTSIRGPFPAAGQGPVPMTFPEAQYIRQAAYHATRVYPGPVGELISRELLSWADFGYRLGGNRPVMELVEHVLKQPRAAVAAIEAPEVAA